MNAKLLRIASGGMMVASLGTGILGFAHGVGAQATPGSSAERLLGESGMEAYDIQKGGAAGLASMVGSVVKTAISLLGILLLVYLVYGGFLWMTAGGNAENTTKAMTIIKNAIIGLAIILSAYAISSFVLDSLLKASGVKG